MKIVVICSNSVERSWEIISGVHAVLLQFNQLNNHTPISCIEDLFLLKNQQLDWVYKLDVACGGCPLHDFYLRHYSLKYDAPHR